MDFEIANSDCLEAMRSMESCSVDAVLTDPPYAIGFMNAKWDNYGSGGGNESIDERRTKAREYASDNSGAPRCGNSHGTRVTLDEMVAFQESMTPIFAEMLRIAKPGAHILSFGSPRTFHRMTCAMENAGWEIRDCLMWVYSQGYPKGLSIGRKLPEWDGWNTCLKPAWEPIVLARKAPDGSVTANVAKHGVGGINVDACRVPTEPHDSSRDGEPSSETRYADKGSTNFAAKPGPRGGDERGRFPANLIHDGSDDVLACFPDAPGQIADLRGGIPKKKGVCYGEFPSTIEHMKRAESDTSAARFFYCAKATKADRGEFNDHISVKPNALMRYLVRLICPPGGGSHRPIHGEWQHGRRVHAGGNALHRHRA